MQLLDKVTEVCYYANGTFFEVSGKGSDIMTTSFQVKISYNDGDSTQTKTFDDFDQAIDSETPALAMANDFKVLFDSATYVEKAVTVSRVHTYREA